MPTKSAKFFWLNFESYFEKTGLKNKDFAEKVDVKPSYTSMILNRKRIAETFVYRVSELLKIPVSVLIGDCEEAPNALEHMAKNTEEITKAWVYGNYK